jgi:hypothetical protein
MKGIFADFYLDPFKECYFFKECSNPVTKKEYKRWLLNRGRQIWNIIRDVGFIVQEADVWRPGGLNVWMVGAPEFMYLTSEKQKLKWIIGIKLIWLYQGPWDKPAGPGPCQN